MRDTRFGGNWPPAAPHGVITLAQDSHSHLLVVCACSARHRKGGKEMSEPENAYLERSNAGGDSLEKTPWLVAAWPGMGSVAMIATLTLVQKLGAKPVAGLSSRGYFDVAQVEVTDGLIRTPRLPRSVFYRW